MGSRVLDVLASKLRMPLPGDTAGVLIDDKLPYLLESLESSVKEPTGKANSDHQEEVGLLLLMGTETTLNVPTSVSESSLDIKFMMLSRQVQQNQSEKEHRPLKKDSLQP